MNTDFKLQLRKVLIAMVKGYQLLISPFLGNNCRFYPTCSAYCIEAMETHGAFKGLYLGIRRVLRCHPFKEGGVDPVPPAHPPLTCNQCCSDSPSSIQTMVNNTQKQHAECAQAGQTDKKDA